MSETPSPDAPPAADAAPAAQAAPAPGVARRRWPAVLAGTTAALLVAAAGTGAWWWQRPASLPWLLAQVPGLKVQGVQGLPGDASWRIATLDWALPGQAGTLHAEDLVLTRERLRWRPFDGAWLGLSLAELSAQRVSYRSGPPSATPLAAPADLRLPLALQVARLRIGTLAVDELPPLQQVQARLALGERNGAQHRIDQLSLTLDQAQVTGQLQIGADAPLDLRARLSARRLDGAPASVPPWQADAEVSGPLARLAVTLRLQGTAATPGLAAPRVDARATVAPFAAWPLAALQFETRALDLAALSPRLPATLLDGQATVDSDGLDRPARIQLQLTNQRPAAWLATGAGTAPAGLPLRSLVATASATPRQPDRLDVTQFTLQLADAQGPAGRISGSGHWQGAEARLALQLDALQPARLDRRSPALDVSGPLALVLSQLRAVSGADGRLRPADPALAFDARLVGQLRTTGPQRPGARTPVQLRAVGEASATHLQLREADAQAGEAHAQATLEARLEPLGWRLQGQGRLSRFDPLPWWPGNPGSAWQRGPHRLDGQFDTRLLWRTQPGGGASPWPGLPALEGQATLSLTDSVLAGVPVSGRLALDGSAARPRIDATLDAAGNRLALRWQAGAQPADDHAELDWQGPHLAALAPLGQLLADGVPALATLWPQGSSHNIAGGAAAAQALQGSLQGSLKLDGRWPALRRSEGQWRADGLSVAGAALQSGTLAWRTGADADAPLSVQLQARGLSQGSQRLDRLDLQADGSLREHNLKLRADSPVRPPAWTEPLLGSAGTGSRIDLDARGRWLGAPGAARWQAQAVRLRAGARQTAETAAAPSPWLDAQWPLAELRLDAGFRPVAFDAGPGRVQFASTGFQWQALRWQAGAGQGPGSWDVRGTLETVDVARLLQKLQPDMGWSGQLTLGGKVDIRSGERLDADIVLERSAGDLAITDELGQTQALGLTDLRLALSVHDGLWQFAQGLAGRSIGAIAGAQVLRADPRQRWPGRESRLDGVLEARVANLGVWGTWVPPGWRLAGELHTSASLGGTLGAPQLRGSMAGQDIAVRNLLQGIQLQEGQLAISLDGDQARIERLRFKGGDGGTLTLTGQAALGATPSATLNLVAERFRAVGRVDRRVLVSGRATAKLDAERLQLDGDLKIDEGTLDISHGEAPTLDSDVHVRRSSGDAVAVSGAAAASGATSGPATGAATGTARGTASSVATGPSGGATPANGRPAAAPLPLPLPLRQAQVALRIDLGERLTLHGRGVDTGLRGKLQVSSPGGRLALQGTVRTEGGQYAAYGQKLDIQRGELRFTGALDNPALDVRAVRPNLDVLVGVAVSGTAQAPRIRLFSEPELGDYEKLSWLVLGRSPDGLGRTDTALLQRAALALLAGGDGQAPTDTLLDALGLTDFSVRQTEGEVRDTVISLGKQLSRRWYLGYERSVNTTTGTWQLIYRIAQRFTLRAQSGGENAVDLIWSWRW